MELTDLSFAREKVYRTKQEYVYKVLSEAIMKCKIPPGEKLVISNIASQLEVSAIPVREALQILHSERLITYNQHIGAVVTPITKSSVVETFTIKEGLETVATRIAVQKITQEEINHLKEQIAGMDYVIQNEKHEKWGQLNSEFHKSIVKAAEMPVLAEMHSKMIDEWNRIRRYFFHEVLSHRHIQSHDDHQEILTSIKEGNSEKAGQLTKKHNHQALQDYIDYLVKQDEEE